MKKTMKMMLALMAGAMVFTACSSDDIIENNGGIETPSQLKPMTFTAVQEGEGGTRTAIDGLLINWTAGDKMSIFDGVGDQQFTIQNGVGSTSATFTGEAASAATYYALYPYAVGETQGPKVTKDDVLPIVAARLTAAYGSPEAAEYAESKLEEIENMWPRYIDRENAGRGSATEGMRDYLYGIGLGFSEEEKDIIIAYLKEEGVTVPGAQLDGSSIKNVVIPAEQTVADGQTVDPQAMVMVAKGAGENNLQFKNVCAYVKVTPQFNCHAICISSKGLEKLAGKMDVNYNGDVPTSTVTANGTNTVYLKGTITAGNAYYIAVRPETLASGFTIEFLTADKGYYYARSTNNALNLERSNIKNLGSFTTSGNWTVAQSAESYNGGNLSTLKTL